MAVSLTTAQVIYAAETRLLEWADIVAESSSFNRVKDYIKKGEALIRYIRVLNTATLTFEEQLAICQHMIQIGNLYDFPASPTITSTQQPIFSSNIIIQGEQGPPGQDGGGTDYNTFGLINNSVVDSFLVSSANGADWTYVITDGVNLRKGTIGAGWLSDGSNVVFYDNSTIDIGNTNAIELSVVFGSGQIRLFATIVSGTWDIRGTRYFNPNNGAGVGVVSPVLPNGRILIGDATNTAQSQIVTGDVTLSNSGVTSITSDIIVDADINSSASITLTKLAALTASKAVVTNSSGFLTSGTATSTEVSYLSGVTSAIQTQLDSKIGTVTGAISTVVSTNLTASRVVISDPSGKIAVSGVTSTELGFLSGATSSIQTQVSNKVSKTGDTITGSIVATSGVNLVLNGSGILSTENGGFVGGTTGQGGFPGGISTQNPYPPYWKIIISNIGDWNMDTTATLTVPFPSGVTRDKIRNISVQVRSDADAIILSNLPLCDTIDTGGIGTREGGISSVDNTTGGITLWRRTGGRFDGAEWNATSYNRGWITILHEV